MKARIIFSLLVVCMLASSSEASILSQMLTYDGVVDLANDNSEGVITDTNHDTVPDLVQGVVWIDSVNGVNVFAKTGGSIFAVYSFAITPTGTTGQFSSVAATGTNSVNSLLKRGGAGGADFSTLTPYNATVTNPAVALIEVPGSFTFNDWRNIAPAGSPLSLDFIPTATVGDFSPFLVDITAGFDGLDDNHTIDIIIPSGPGSPIGFFSGVYSIAETNIGGPFQPITSPAIPGLGFPGGTGDIVIPDGTISAASALTGAVGHGFNFSDKGNYAINPLPEPMSMLVWAGLAGIAGLVTNRRLRNI